MTGLPAAAGLAGAGIGVGLLLIAAGLLPASRTSEPSHLPGLGLPGRLRASRYGDRVAGRLGLAIAAGVVVGAATGWPVAALLAAAGGLALPGLASGSGRRTQIAQVEAVAGWAEMLRDTLAGAAGLEQAITATAPVAPAPIREPVVVLAGRLERGQRLAPALREFADDVADPTCDLVVAALVLAAEHQTRRLADLLGTLAAAARDQASMRLRVEAGRARTRTSVRVIIGATTALVVGLAVLNRGYLTPYNTATGQLVLLAVGLLFAGAFGWLARMTRPPDTARVLVNAPAPLTGPPPGIRSGADVPGGGR